MQKKVMALAVAGVLAAPVAAFAQANYEIYGRANVGLDQYQATGAANATADFKSRTRVFDQGSRIGFRGTEDLGGGLKAIFQIESGVNIDTGGCNGQSGTLNPAPTSNPAGCSNASTGFLASRDSFAGLQGNFGRVTFGRQSIFWANGAINQFQANYINAEIPWTNGAALKTGAGVSRQSNTLAYTTPTVSGMNGTLSYSPNAAENVGAGANADGKIVGLTVRYTSPLVAQFDWVNNKANSTATGQPEATQWKLGVGFNYMPGGLVSFVYTAGEAKTAAGVKAKSAAWTLNAEHQIGSIQVMAQYGVAGKIKVDGTEQADTGAKAYLLGARYFMSKRTWTYLTFTQVKNEAAQTYDYTGGDMTSAQTLAATNGVGLPSGSAGADPRIIAVGLLHNF